jgi:hypothetical protein
LPRGEGAGLSSQFITAGSSPVVLANKKGAVICKM